MHVYDFEHYGMKATWTLLSICYSGNHILLVGEDEPKFMQGAEVIKYAQGLLGSPDQKELLALSILREDEEEEIVKALKSLSDAENCDYNFEFRKFRAMYFYKNLPRWYIDANEVWGMIKMKELWCEFDFPDDALIFKYDYLNYTPENYKILLKAHEDWVREEFEALKEEPPSPEHSP